MFPTIGDLLQYVFHVHITFPVQTFGFFVALSFFVTYFVFVSEFKRKEADGLISSYKEKEWVGLPASVLELLVNGLLGFILGFKIPAAVIDYKVFKNDPVGFIFSIRGNIWAGLLFAVAFAFWIYTDRRKQQLPKPKIVEKEVHPYQLSGYLVFALGFWGFIGAKLFNAAENLRLFFHHPVDTLFSANGFTYYGGLIFGALTYLYICHKKGMKLVHLADIGSPGMMLAYGVGRIGCHLSGDGDWGIVNTHPIPALLNWLPDWMWSFKFPHNTIDAGVKMDGCFGDHCEQLRAGVYPTSFYEAVICIGLFGLMWMFRKHIRVPGLMFYSFLILSGIERIFIETIRVNQQYPVLGLQLTQAEMISAAMIIGGLAGLTSIVYRQIKNGGQIHFEK
jgi:phosphatidylglycerol:prolipoprotein diacylglycerol transferase